MKILINQGEQMNLFKNGRIIGSISAVRKVDIKIEIVEYEAVKIARCEHEGVFVQYIIDRYEISKIGGDK